MSKIIIHTQLILAMFKIYKPNSNRLSNLHENNLLSIVRNTTKNITTRLFALQIWKIEVCTQTLLTSTVHVIGAFNAILMTGCIRKQFFHSNIQCALQKIPPSGHLSNGDSVSLCRHITVTGLKKKTLLYVGSLFTAL
jgi:hypothetical protein